MDERRVRLVEVRNCDLRRGRGGQLRCKDVEAPILGVILNTLDISDRRYGYYYYAYGGYGDAKKAEA